MVSVKFHLFFLVIVAVSLEVASERSTKKKLTKTDCHISKVEKEKEDFMTCFKEVTNKKFSKTTALKMLNNQQARAKMLSCIAYAEGILTPEDGEVKFNKQRAQDVLLNGIHRMTNANKDVKEIMKDKTIQCGAERYEMNTQDEMGKYYKCIENLVKTFCQVDVTPKKEKKNDSKKSKPKTFGRMGWGKWKKQTEEEEEQDEEWQTVEENQDEDGRTDEE